MVEHPSPSVVRSRTKLHFYRGCPRWPERRAIDVRVYSPSCVDKNVSYCAPSSGFRRYFVETRDANAIALSQNAIPHPGRDDTYIYGLEFGNSKSGIGCGIDDLPRYETRATDDPPPTLLVNRNVINLTPIKPDVCIPSPAPLRFTNIPKQIFRVEGKYLSKNKTHNRIPKQPQPKINNI